MRMKQTPRLALLTLALGLLAACSTPTRQAPVIDRPVASAHHLKPAPAPAPAPAAAEESRQDSAGSYTVHKGDTLLRIALDHGQNYHDLVSWNNLADPDDIKVGQVLRVSPPERVAGAQTTPVPMPEPRTAVPRKQLPAPAPAKGKELADAVKPETRPEASGPAPGTLVTANDDERLSWMWPATGRIVATFEDGNNKGIDIAGKLGIPAPSSLEALRRKPDYEGWMFGIITLDAALLDDTIERVNITLPRRVLRRLDALAQAAGESRSGYIAHLTLETPPARLPP